jgi:pyruvate ferredoxin oxidoreductase alpha subunit
METKSLIGTANKKGQKFVDPKYLFFEAPREASFMTCSEVIKEAIRRASVDLMVAYPITPQSEACPHW